MIKVTLYTGANQCLTTGASCCVSFRDESISKGMSDFQAMFPDPLLNTDDYVDTWRVERGLGGELLAEGGVSDDCMGRWEENPDNSVYEMLNYIAHELLAHMLIAGKVKLAQEIAEGEGLEVIGISIDGKKRYVVAVE